MRLDFHQVHEQAFDDYQKKYAQPAADEFPAVPPQPGY